MEERVCELIDKFLHHRGDGDCGGDSGRVAVVGDTVVGVLGQEDAQRPEFGAQTPSL